MNNGVYWVYAADLDHNISSPEVFSIMGVGLEQDRDELIEVYPNPVESLLTLELDASSAHLIHITSLEGKRVFSMIAEGTTVQIDLSSLQEGVYLLQILSGELIHTRKLIKL